MQKQIQLRVTPDVAFQPSVLREYVARELACDGRTIKAVHIRKRSIDARQRSVFVNLSLNIYINEEPPALDYEQVAYKDVSHADRVIVVGAGPGGLFAALRLIELGLRPVVLERGKDVRERRKWMPRATTPLEKAVRGLIPMENSIRAARKEATPIRFSAFSASLEHLPIFLSMRIHTSVQTSCRA